MLISVTRREQNADYWKVILPALHCLTFTRITLAQTESALTTLTPCSMTTYSAVVSPHALRAGYRHL